ncbi:MAG: hypothetical protein JWM78_1645 [Verrucomicrobiaceae bacterium]|nr:hypothetical protein [Verrucomicrobiaceae bacterium]
MKKDSTDPLANERRTALEAIIGEVKVATFWRDHGLGEIGITENYFRQLLSGNRNIGDRTTRKLENALGRKLVVDAGKPDGVSEETPKRYAPSQSLAVQKTIKRLVDLDSRGRLSSTLLRTINSVIDLASQSAPATQLSGNELINLPDSQNLGLDDEPELVNLSEYLAGAMAALDEFRDRKNNAQGEQKTKAS